MRSMGVSSCRCCMFVSCVHHVAVLSAAFCMTYAGRGCKNPPYRRGILQSRSHDCLIDNNNNYYYLKTNIQCI